MSSSLLFLWRLAWRFRLVVSVISAWTLPTTASIRPETCKRPLGQLLRSKTGGRIWARSPVSTIVGAKACTAQRLRATISCKNSLREVTSPSAHGSESDAAQFGSRGAKIAHTHGSPQNRLPSLRDVAIASIARHRCCTGAPGTHAPAHAVDALQNSAVVRPPP